MPRYLALSLLALAFSCAAPSLDVSREELDPLLVAGDREAVDDLLGRGMDPGFGLVRAARVGSLPMLEHFLALGVDPNSSLDDGYHSTALMAGASGNHPEVIAPLLAAGADLDQQDTLGDPAINWAAYMGHEEYVRALLAAGARSDIRSPHGDAFEIALRQGWRSMIVLLSSEPASGLEGTARDLVAAAIADDSVGVARALSEGASPDTRTAAGVPVLALVAELDHVPDVRALLNAGADVDAADPIGFTPLMAAARGGAVAAIRVLAKAGADLEHRAEVQGMGMSALHMAAAKGRTAAALELLDLGAWANPRNARGETALMWAVTEGHPETALALLRAGSDPDLADEAGYTARQAAKDFEYVELLAAME